MHITFLYDATDGPAVPPKKLISAALANGYEVHLRDIIQESLEKSVPALARPKLKLLVHDRHRYDIVLVARLECLGVDALDIHRTVEQMRYSGIIVICLEIHPKINLTSSRGTPIMNAIAAFAKVLTAARGTLVRKGQAKALARGQSLGRNVELSDVHRNQLLQLLNLGSSAADAGRAVGVDRFTVYRLAKREGIRLPVRGAKRSL